MAKTNLKDFIFKKNYIPKLICTGIINKIKDAKTKQHQWYHYNSDKFDSYKSKEPQILWADETTQANLIRYVNKAIVDYEKKHIKMINRISPIRFNMYHKGLTMREHTDFIHSIFDGKEKGIPIISIVGVLNDSYKGGDFLMNKEKISFKTGDILIFPSTFLYPHVVKEVTEGIRYSFVAWAY
jgi:predicted 2-oxoglutarate/Fe(II)-dependent dioxygenase YbiX